MGADKGERTHRRGDEEASNVAATVNSVRPKIIDYFQIQIKWTSKGQLPVETALQNDPGSTFAQVGAYSITDYTLAAC